MKQRLYKAISILLTFLMVLSVTVCALGTVSATTKLTYYVAAAGADSNNGLSAEKPFKTIGKAVTAAKAEGLTEGDTLNLRLCRFASVEWGTVPAYDFLLDIESDDPTLRSGVTIPTDFKFQGDVYFSYIRMDGAINNVYYNNHNINIADDCTFTINNHYLGSNNGSQTDATQNVVLGQVLVNKKVYIGDNGKAKTYNSDVSLGINNASSTPKVIMGSTNGITTFKGNLNLNIMRSKTIDFEIGAGGIDLQGALQVVVNSDIDILNEEKTTLASINADEGYYYITNATRVGDILGFTATAGTYTVDTSRYNVKATDKNNNVYIANDGLLVLPTAGEYVVTSVKEIETPIYYVSSEGSSLNDGLSPQKPLSAINEVITAAVEAGYWEGDTVYVNVLSSTVDWSNEYKINSTTEMVVDEYDYLLCVQSNNKSSLSTVNFVYRQPMTGDVEFQDIKLNLGSKNGSRLFYANNHSVTIGDNVTLSLSNFAFGTFDGSGKFDGQSITFKNALDTSVSLGNDGHHNGRSFAEDVSLTLDNPRLKAKMYISCYHGGTTTMKKNFNIQIKAAEYAEIIKGSTIKPDTVSRISVLGAIQLIVNDDVIVSPNSIKVLKSCSDSGQFYYLSNVSGIKDLLEYTETAGKYKVNLGSDRCTVYAVDENGNTMTSKDGYLTLPKSGEYIIDAKATPIVKEYFVSSNGSDENDGLSDANPVATVSRVFELANKAGCVEVDTVVIKVLGSNFTFVNPPAYKFNVKYTSATSTRVNLNMDGANVLANSTNGVTTFDNVKVNFSATWKGILLSNSNVVFTENSTFSSYVTVGLLTSNGSGSATAQSAQKVVFEGKTPYDIALSNTSWANVTRTGDVELVFNSSMASPRLRLNASYGGSVNGTTKYKNLNLNFKNAASVLFEYCSNVTVDGAIQIIDSANLGINSLTTGLADVNAEKYIITNNTGIKDIIEFTETTGKYKVDTDKYSVTATKEGSEPITAENGYIVLPNAGEYVLTLTHTHTFTDICDQQCNSCDYLRVNFHSYDTSCHTTCNLCEYVREINHTYDNGCDKLCNVCYQYRKTSHKFSTIVDRDCDKCGALRSVEGKVLFKEVDGYTYYFVNGYKSNVTAVVNIDSKYYYVKDGKWNSSVNAIVKMGDKYYYVKQGVWSKSTTALVKLDNKYHYINAGMYDPSVTDVIKISGKYYYIKKGKWSKTTLLFKDGSKYYYVKKGVYSSKVTDIIKVSGKYYYIKKGKWSKTTLLYKKSGKYYYVKKGIYSSKTNTLYKKSGKYYAIKSGKWYKSKAIIKYSGKKYYVNKGYAQLKFSGKVKIGKKTYTIKKGVVK